ncbi:unannotated protein [freshwater metagenome]|uniref:Unannotated protein n=1 Tax=freshwater metagenome TaxID=449393 RepID=A0A6J7I3N1_9ZZZZ
MELIASSTAGHRSAGIDASELNGTSVTLSPGVLENGSSQGDSLRVRVVDHSSPGTRFEIAALMSSCIRSKAGSTVL